MPGLERLEDGTWQMTSSRRGGQLGDQLHDQALVRNLNAFDPAFTRAREVCEFEFILTLLRPRGMEAAGWDSFVSTREAISTARRIGNEIGRRRGSFAVARHLHLWIYGHIVEASELYEILANLLDIASGGRFIAWRFPDENSRPVPVARRIDAIKTQAAPSGLDSVGEPFDEVYDRPLRNGIFHADYALHGGEVRLPREGRVYTHQEVMELVNYALAYFDALTILFDTHARSYTQPVRIPVSSTFAGGAEEDGTVIVREGHGLVGIKHSLSPAELAGGGIPWRLGIFTPTEVAMLDQDPQLATLPRRKQSRLRSLLTRALRLLKR